MILRRPALLVLSLVACTSAGCGGGEGPSDDPSDDRSAVEAVMKSYLGALADGDGDKACSHLTAAAKRQVVAEIRTLDPALGSASCVEALGNLAESTGASTARQVCGASGGAECERIARRTAKDLIRDLKDVEIAVEVSGDAATAGPAAGTERFDGRLQKIEGRWLISEFATI